MWHLAPCLTKAVKIPPAPLMMFLFWCFLEGVEEEICTVSSLSGFSLVGEGVGVIFLL